MCGLGYQRAEGIRISASEERSIESGTDIERTVYFSDAVFAIAITILALDLQVPEDLAAVGLPSALLELWPKFVSFLLSFWIIASYWLAHHRIFHHIGAYDRGMLLINLLFLMWVVLLPFSSSLIGEYEDARLAAIVYALHNIVASSTLSWLWWHASKDGRLVKANLDARVVRYNKLRGLFLPAIFLLSIGLSFVSVDLARLSWLLAFLATPVLRGRARRSSSA
jgi:uncharacterized membrane protein